MKFIKTYVMEDVIENESKRDYDYKRSHNKFAVLKLNLHNGLTI